MGGRWKREGYSLQSDGRGFSHTICCLFNCVTLTSKVLHSVCESAFSHISQSKYYLRLRLPGGRTEGSWLGAWHCESIPGEFSKAVIFIQPEASDVFSPCSRGVVSLLRRLLGAPGLAPKVTEISLGGLYHPFLILRACRAAVRLAEVYIASHVAEKSNIQNVFQKAFWHSLTFDTLSPGRHML